jgi:hypothetical protein
MPTPIRLIWITITITFLVLNSALNYSLFLSILNLIPISTTGYIITSYYNEFRWNTPWGIPYFFLVALNFSNFEKTIVKSASSLGVGDSFALLLKWALLILFAIIVWVIIRQKQKLVSNP